MTEEVVVGRENYTRTETLRLKIGGEKWPKKKQIAWQIGEWSGGVAGAENSYRWAVGKRSGTGGMGPDCDEPGMLD